MARGDVVIANSQFTADAIERLYPFARGRLTVIPRGTDLARFSPAAVERARVTRLREAWGVAPHERVVLLAARLTEWKGQRVLIEAARLLKERGLADVRFVLAGDAQGRDCLRARSRPRIRRAGLEGVVARVGHCHDMPAALVAASVVAVPSTEPEAFGRSAVEAQAMGTMVVVSDSGAAPETVLAPPQRPAQARTGWRVAAGRRAGARRRVDQRADARRDGARRHRAARPRPRRSEFLARADDREDARRLSRDAGEVGNLIRRLRRPIARRRRLGDGCRSYRMKDPSRRSVSAWRISAWVFMTIGPCQAIGSRSGGRRPAGSARPARPPGRRPRRPSRTPPASDRRRRRAPAFRRRRPAPRAARRTAREAPAKVAEPSKM